MASKTRITNMALARIGESKQIANVDSDTSRAAIIARTEWDDLVKYVLRDFPWPFATAYADLNLVGGTASAAVNSDWQYSYRYPSDCEYARRIVIASVGRVDPKPPPFRIGRDSQGKLIFTDEAEAELEYTIRITDVEEWDSLAVSMLAWKLGAALAPSLSRIDGMEKKCMAMYEVDKSKAESRALNEGQQQDPLEAEMIRARE